MRYILKTIILCCFTIPLLAQEIRTNTKGEKIIVYPDGRVEYFNGDPVDPADIPGDGTQAYPVFEGYIEPLDDQVSLNEADIFKIAQRRSQLSTSAAEIARNRLQQAQQNLEQTNAKLAASSPQSESYALIQRQQAAASEALQQSMQEAQEANRLAFQTGQVLEKGGFIESFNTRQVAYRDAQQQSQQLRLGTGQSYATLLPLTNNTLNAGPADLLRHPPRRVCRFAFEGQDTERDAYRRDTEKTLLFTYTDERLRPYLKEKEYLSCEAYLTSVGGYRYLTLAFTFAYPNAREAYGFIERNSMLTLKMLNGDYVNLQAGVMDKGKYNTVKQELTYEIYYPIDRSHINMLKNSELDLVRVFWSSGYEEYPIQQLDFFQWHFACLGD